MWQLLRRIALGVFLILVTSSILLFSDWNRRKTGAQEIPRIAIFKYASHGPLDDTHEGILAALREEGFIAGQTLLLREYNAEGDIGTTNAIAREVTSGSFDLVVTISTPCLQAVANANRAGKTLHVFSATADPFAAGVGLDPDNPMEHPPYMVGIGSFPPVRESFELARRFNPALQSVGVPWNPAESNSQAAMKVAREVAAELGIRLLEASAENTAALPDAVRSVISQGAEAIWIGADNTASIGSESIISIARKDGIPTFSCLAGGAEKGALFGIGTSFEDVGRLSGRQVADILRGVDPATLPVENISPTGIEVNRTALQGIRGRWSIPAEIEKEASVVIDESGVHKRSVEPQAGVRRDGPLFKTWNVQLIQYTKVVDVEESEEGVLAGLKESGLVEGRDYTVKIRNALGDMATVSALIDAALTDGADLIITFSTPTLQAALRRAGQVPVVFTYLASAQAAGAGTSDTDHLPNVTGVYSNSDSEGMMKIVKECLPGVRRLGTLFVPAEVNTVHHKDLLVSAAGRAGIEVIALPVNSSSEASDAALALASQDIDAVCQIPGNLTASSFVTILAAAQKARLPVFAYMSSQADAGADIVLSRDYFEGGHQAGLLAARVMRGGDPSKIPFQPQLTTTLTVNLEAARRSGLRIPETLIARADRVIGR